MVTRRNLTLVFLFWVLWIILALVMPLVSASAAHRRITFSVLDAE